MEVVGFSYSLGDEGNINFATSFTFERSQYHFFIDTIWYLLALSCVLLKCQMLIAYNQPFKLLCKQQAV